MQHLADSRQMKAVDHYTIETIGIPALVLMEHAALEVARYIGERHEKGSRIIAVCGMGNNGGDGLAVARILNMMGFQSGVFLIGDEVKASTETKSQLEILRHLDISEYTDLSVLSQADAIIDAIFGIGLTREVTGPYQTVIKAINDSGKAVYAVDMPSGISTDNGQILGCAVKADVTITFGCLKLGLVLYPGAQYAGEIIVRNIGFPESAKVAANISVYAYDREDLVRLPKRPSYSNKGTFGKILVIAGSKNMSGACYFSAMAAYRTGCGLVRILTSEDNRIILQQQLPEAVMTTYRNEECIDNLPECFETALAWADSVILGPGLGITPVGANIVRYICEACRVPLVIDADALNLISGHLELLKDIQCPAVLTPHLGEMARLTGKSISDIQLQLIDICRDFAGKYLVTCVLKDARTVICGEGSPTFINMSGNSGMACGGSGDVLSGIIGSLLMAALKPVEAAALGCFIHGLAGDEAKKACGTYGLLASDIIQYISKVMMQ